MAESSLRSVIAISRVKVSRTIDTLNLLRVNLQPGTVLLQQVLRRSGIISGFIFPED
jgi:hypothetical protein